MNDEQCAEFSLIAKQCDSGQYRSINVGSKVRSDAIVAAWTALLEMRDALIKQDEYWANLQLHHPHLVGPQRDAIWAILRPGEEVPVATLDVEVE